MARKLIVEAIGTFFLVLTVGLIVTAANPTPFAGLAIGSALMIMVYAGGHISGGHYNPAVTLAVLVRGSAGSRDLIGYWVAQLIAGGIAGALANFFAETSPVAGNPDLLFAAMAEFLFTFALCYVVLNTATTRGTEGNSYYGLAIGFTVMVGAYAVGPISGAVFNPAVALGLLVAGISTFKTFAVYAVVTLAGGLAAGAVFRALDMGNDKSLTSTPAQQADLQQAGSTRR